MDEKAVREELLNICFHKRVFPGDTLSHKTANECVRRGWAKRDAEGWFVATPAGLVQELTSFRGSPNQEE